MREVAVFLSPTLYDANKSFVEGLKKNDISVTRFSIDEEGKKQQQQQQQGSSNENPYLDAVTRHNEKIASSPEGLFSQHYKDSSTSARSELTNHNNNSKNNKKTKIEEYNFLCIAIEDTLTGVREARAAGMCVVGCGSNEIEINRLKAQGRAHATASSISDLLDQFHVKNYFQVQYLPYSIYLRDRAARKVGYPVSFLDNLCGRFILRRGQNKARRISSFDSQDTEHGDHVFINACGDNDDDDDDDDDDIEDDGLEESNEDDTRWMELDVNANRIIPREILGIRKGSLADVYINNVGWPQDKINTFHFNSRGLEMDVIRMFAKLYETPYEEMRGFVTSGGTEGNFTSLWWQRDYLKEKSNGHMPLLLTSNMTHYSISKAAQQLQIEGRLVKSDKNGVLDCDDLESILSQISVDEPERPILMNVNFGTTMTGSLDILPDIHKILMKKVHNRGGVFSVHIDAALMGAVVPVIEPFGKVNYFRDFNVKTIAISGHKFFGSVCICGVLLTTRQFLEECSEQKLRNGTGNKEVKYLTGLHDITPSGSRSGFNVLSFHNTLCGLYMHTDSRRLKDVVYNCYECVEYFVQKMKALLVGKDIMIVPDHSLTICFPRPSPRMMEKWSLMPVNMPSNNGNDDSAIIDEDELEYAGVCVLANVDKKRIDRFMAEYKKDKAVTDYIWSL